VPPNVHRSGKEALLPAPPPLRTARAPFNARSSSIGQRTGEGTRSPHWSWGKTWTLLRGSQPRNRRKLHQQGALHARRLICFASSSRFAHRSRPSTLEGSLPPCGWSSNPYPAHYRSAFACSLVLYPQPHQRTLRFAFLGRRTTGLPRSADTTEQVRSCLWAGGAPSAAEDR
jgi:hypothetical protein